MFGLHHLSDRDQFEIKGNDFVQSELNELFIVVRGHITGLYDINLSFESYKNKPFELIEILYRKYQDEFHKFLNGQFIIVIRDKNKKKTGIYNNRYLATNLYYHFDEDRLVFSSSFKELLNKEKIEKKIDYSVMKQFLSNGWNATDKTMIQGVHRIQPTCRIIATDKVVIENHWKEEFEFNRKPFANLETHMDSYEAIYRDGICEFISAKKTQNLGTLLSGGHDTSFALIQGRKVFGKPLHCFTATFPGWAFDEGDYAENLTRKFDSIYHPVAFGPEDLDFMPSLIIANEEPVVGSSLPLHLCAKEASKHVDTMMGGDGGDTLWGEYFPVAEYHKYIKDLPLRARKFLYEITKVLRKTFDWERFWELEHVAELFTHENMYDSFLRRLCTYRHFSDDFINQLLQPDISKYDFARSSIELPFTKENFSEMLIEGKMLNGFYNYQSFHTYRSMEYFGMDLYFPTINREFMRLITNLPKEWVNGGTTFHKLTNAHSVNRRFHKKVLSRYLKKEEIYNRSFDIPWYNILKPRKALLEKLLQRLKKRGWYNPDQLEKLFSEFQSQTVKDYELLELKHHGYRIFTLLSLEIWCIEFLDEKNTPNPDEKISLEDYLTEQ